MAGGELRRRGWGWEDWYAEPLRASFGRTGVDTVICRASGQGRGWEIKSWPGSGHSLTSKGEGRRAW